ncbi:hypothetical protein NUU18_04180 [Pediococcus pentosaceus]|uniref:hypothetical protein n=1 Tax=Pediococcus pentosaceus TaxID=1255 RepID=UPI0021E7C50E|nr:hypothetical protein [Pediococcus pentosaceus]MCV3325577.1 hypothetical protein [Pediococcus pentosaceus]
MQKLDEKVTKEKNKQILSKYRQYQAYINAPVNPRVTANWGNGQPRGTAPTSEYAEQRLIKAEEGKAYCAWIDWAINGCHSNKYRELLKIVYCEGCENGHAYNLDMLVQRLPNKYYGISSTTYFNWLSLALLDVAERLGSQVYKTV